MKKIWVLVLCLFVSSMIYAAPTINGPTGLIEMPTAKSMEYKKIGFGVDYDMGNRAQGQENQYLYKVNLGTFQNWELGIVGGSIPTEGVFVNAKYFLMSDNDQYPLSIAVGIENIGSHHDTGAYLVSSKKFEGGFDAHFGFKATFEEELDAAAMLGMEYMIDERFSILGDLTGEQKKYILNLGMRFYFDENIVLRASILDVTQLRQEESIYNVGIAFEKFM